ncbi:lytic murein transglycosylase [Curvibacter sp. CHRR-16]|nr:lytic murein transglycosylase [Curvibacter sp. CHRR-16]
MGGVQHVAPGSAAPHWGLPIALLVCVALLSGCSVLSLGQSANPAPVLGPSSAPVPPAGSTSAPAVPAASSTPSAPASAPLSAAERAQQFARWVDAFRSSARAAGIGEATLHAALDTVRYLPQVVQADKVQPEFSRPVWDYLDSAVSAQRVARGQDKLRQLSAVLGPIATRYGVPAEVLVAIWGVESSFGTYTGDIPTIDALATLGFEGRREAWARSQLMAALTIVQNGDIDRSHMLGSWAGAMGQTQFLPTVYVAHAVDADGDGRRDIWGSIPDVMASTANFIAHSGWKADQVWGLEVRLPAGFDYASTDTRLSSEQWADKGVSAMDGKQLPALADATILLPAGARGPAFLIGNNFRTILRYNNATSYALAISLLAQRLANGPAVQAAWPRDQQPLSRSQVLALQQALNAQGFDCGTPDGIAGAATRSCIRRYQSSQGLAADGFATLELLQRL